MLGFDAAWLPPSKEKASKLAKNGKRETIGFESLNPYHTTPEEVDREMREAIKAAGLNISPQAFIALCSAKAKKDYK